MLSPPAIAFARRDGTHLAYQSSGSGPPDIVFVAGSFATTLAWDEYAPARAFRRLASFSRLVTYDQRGMGYSDPIDPSTTPTVDDLVNDLEAVVAAAGMSDPILFGMHNGAAVAAVYATRHPVQRLVLCNAWARLGAAEDYPIGFSDEVLDHLEDRYRENWGEGRISRYWSRPRPEVEATQLELKSTSRNQAVTLFRMNRDYDIRDALPAVTVPTLVIHLEDNRMIPPSFGRYIAQSIPGARLALVPGGDQIFLHNYSDEVIDALEPFLTGAHTPFMDRMTTTMLFTDIVDSTLTASSLGDERWGALINQHNERVRRSIKASGGHEVKCTGDGFLIAFDDPQAAVGCAWASIEAIAGLGLELRAGVHVGEVSRMGSHDLSGLAVHFAQRLCDRAGGGQVLVSAAVRDACDGSALTFVDEGKAQLKGIPGEWEIFAAHLSSEGGLTRD
ncbi:MAG: adenylate/guanylate cyclase domain-containing protein [Acidimicrobiales bacterium]